MIMLDCKNIKKYNEFGGKEYVYIRLYTSISDCRSYRSC